MRPATSDDDVTEVTFAGEKPTWNYTKAVEPVSKKATPRPDVLTPAAKTRYAVLIAMLIAGAVLAASTDATIPRFLGVLDFGWALGQFLCWPAPR